MEYVKGVAKADTGLKNVDQQGTDRVILCHWETPWVAVVQTQLLYRMQSAAEQATYN